MNLVKGLPPMPGGAGPHLAILTERLLQRIRHALREQDWDGLRVVHFRLLSCVPPAGTTITALAEPLWMTKQAVGQFVAQLEQSGHLELRVDERDRRRRVVVRTGLGDQVVDGVGAAMAALEQQWAEQVGRRRFADFHDVLEELVLG